MRYAYCLPILLLSIISTCLAQPQVEVFAPSEKGEVRVIETSDKGEKISVNPVPAIGASDFSEVTLSDVGTKSLMHAKTTDEGRNKLIQVTTENIGRKLVIVVDGTFFSTPIVRETVSSGILDSSR